MFAYNGPIYFGFDKADAVYRRTNPSRQVIPFFFKKKKNIFLPRKKSKKLNFYRYISDN